MSKQFCKALVGSGWHKTMCHKGASYEHEGAWFCKTHHPPTVKARHEERLAAMRARFAAEQSAMKAQANARREQERRANLYPELLEALIDMQRATQTTDLHFMAAASQKCAAAIAKATKGEA